MDIKRYSNKRKPCLLNTREITDVLNSQITASEHKLSETQLGDLIYRLPILKRAIKFEKGNGYCADKASLEYILDFFRGNSFELAVRRHVFGHKTEEKEAPAPKIEEPKETWYLNKEWYTATKEKLKQRFNAIKILEELYLEGKINNINAAFRIEEKKWKTTLERWGPLADGTNLEGAVYNINQLYEGVRLKIEKTKNDSGKSKLKKNSEEYSNFRLR